MRYLFNLFLILGILFCSSCSNKQYQALFEQKAALSDTSSQKYATKPVDYHIKPHDVLEIKNLQTSHVFSADATTPSTVNAAVAAQGENFEVKDDGTVRLTDLGKVEVAGLTRIQAEEMIEELYHKTLLKDPIIEVKITNLKVTLFGEVRTQGNVPLVQDRTTLVELLGSAGGLTDKANKTNIEIIRGDQKNPKVIVIDMTNIQSINDPRTILQSGDIIYVSENGRAVRSDELQNFSSIYQPAILLLNTALIIISLIRH